MAFRPHPKPLPTPKIRKFLRRSKGIVKVLQAKDVKGKKLPKEETVNVLKEKLDEMFSWYVRLYYADENGNCTCCTCKNMFFWKHIQNGHYVSRDKYPVRWDLQNCDPQCYLCNVVKKGMKVEHLEHIIKTRGQQCVDLLNSKKNNKYKLERFVLRHLLGEVTLKVTELRLKKGL